MPKSEETFCCTIRLRAGEPLNSDPSLWGGGQLLLRVSFMLLVSAILGAQLPQQAYADDCASHAPFLVDDWFALLHIYGSFNCCCCWTNSAGTPCVEDYAYATGPVMCYEPGCTDRLPGGYSWGPCYLGWNIITCQIEVDTHEGKHYRVDEYGNPAHGPSEPYQWMAQGCVCADLVDPDFYVYCQQGSYFETAWVTTYICDHCPPFTPPCYT